MEDILGVVDFLDTSDKLKTMMFAAVNLSRLPGYGPEDTNVCALAERQTNLRATVDQLAAKVDVLGQPVQLDRQQFEISSDVKQTLTLIDKKIDDIRDKVSNIFPPNIATGGTSTSSHVMQTRERNVVVFGIQETSDWRKKLTDVLNFVAGREVTVQDAFRIGRVASGKSRPVLVKLHSTWDRTFSTQQQSGTGFLC